MVIPNPVSKDKGTTQEQILLAVAGMEMQMVF
jgi:hypothetical protein